MTSLFPKGCSFYVSRQELQREIERKRERLSEEPEDGPGVVNLLFRTNDVRELVSLLEISSANP